MSNLCYNCSNELESFKDRFCSEACANEIVYSGFSIRDLHNAFDAVKDPDNWKLTIRADVLSEDCAVTIASINFFAGGGANISAGFTKQGKTYVTVTAPGYYRAVGA